MKKRIFMVIMATAFGLLMNVNAQKITPYALAMKEKAMMQELQSLIEKEVPHVASKEYFTRVKTIENSINKMAVQLEKIYNFTNRQGREWDNSYEVDRKEQVLKVKQWRIENEEKFLIYTGPNVETTGFNLIPNDYHFLMIETLAEIGNGEKSMKRRNMDDWFYINQRYNELVNALDSDQLEILQKNLQGKEEDEFLRFGEKIKKMLPHLAGTEAEIVKKYMAVLNSEEAKKDKIFAADTIVETYIIFFKDVLGRDPLTGSIFQLTLSDRDSVKRIQYFNRLTKDKTQEMSVIGEILPTDGELTIDDVNWISFETGQTRDEGEIIFEGRRNTDHMIMLPEYEPMEIAAKKAVTGYAESLSETAESFLQILQEAWNHLQAYKAYAGASENMK